jgi:excinuclease ABC subunit B
MARFQIRSDFQPQGHQPRAIKACCKNLDKRYPKQILKGVTGSGKTFVMANIIERVQRPTLIITHNKTLVGQLYQEFKGFFPNNSVEYFVSYYDYYQPEAYVASRDIYIEKDAKINEEIDFLRHRATASLFERDDIIIVASVSCIYGLGSPDTYLALKVAIKVGDELSREDLLRNLVKIQYSRGEYLVRGGFRVRGDVVEIFPKSSETGIRVEFFGDEVERISEVDPLTGVSIRSLDQVSVYPAQHYVTFEHQRETAFSEILKEMEEQEQGFKQSEKWIEAQRIRERTQFDLEMMQEIGFCKGIENYSRHLEGRAAGSCPGTLLDYLPSDGLVFLDESHVTIPQLKGMYNGDFSRKSTLVDYGFRLPSALDNRPLKYEEFRCLKYPVIYVSATPGPVELEDARDRLVPLIVRPTGLLDPEILVRPLGFQVDDVIKEAQLRIARNERVFVTTLTKRMAEDLSEYLTENGVDCRYLHSEIDTMERMELIRKLRLGDYHVLIGINLLREGLDVPEVSLVCVMDADKEGFLRSATSLIQTSGRAARNVNGQVIFYADKLTDSMKAAIRESQYRRRLQMEYNKEHGITPKSISKAIAASIYDEIPDKVGREKTALDHQVKEKLDDLVDLDEAQKLLEVKRLNDWMKSASEQLNFELATVLRDKIYELQGKTSQGKSRLKTR